MYLQIKEIEYNKNVGTNTAAIIILKMYMYTDDGAFINEVPLNARTMEMLKNITIPYNVQPTLFKPAENKIRTCANCSLEYILHDHYTNTEICYACESYYNEK